MFRFRVHSRWCYVDAGYGGGGDANSNSQDQSFGGGESYDSGYGSYTGGYSPADERAAAAREYNQSAAGRAAYAQASAARQAQAEAARVESEKVNFTPAKVAQQAPSSYGPLNFLSTLGETAFSVLSGGFANPEFDGQNLIGADRPQGIYAGVPGTFGLGPSIGLTTQGVTLDSGPLAGLAQGLYDDGLEKTFENATAGPVDKLSNVLTSDSSLGNPPPQPEYTAQQRAGLNTPNPFGDGGSSDGGSGGLSTAPVIRPAPAPVQMAALENDPNQRYQFNYGGDVYPSYKEGGLVSEQGDNTMANIDELIRIATDPAYDSADPGVLQQGVAPQGASQSMEYRMNPSYAEGGVVSMNGPQQVAGLTPQATPQSGAVPMQQVEAEMQRMMQQNPQEIMKIKGLIQTAVQAGDVTPEELNMAIQLATASAQNPSLWPQLRQFAIQQGLAAEEDISQEYDQGLVFAVLLASKAVQMQQGGGQPQGPQGMPQGMPQSQGQPPQATMRTGGEVPTSNNADGTVAINAHKGEYVIPEHVVLAKGTDFFDKMIGKDGKASA